MICRDGPTEGIHGTLVRIFHNSHSVSFQNPLNDVSYGKRHELCLPPQTFVMVPCTLFKMQGLQFYTEIDHVERALIAARQLLPAQRLRCTCCCL